MVSSIITRDSIVNYVPFVAHEEFPALEEGSGNEISAWCSYCLVWVQRGLLLIFACFDQCTSYVCVS